MEQTQLALLEKEFTEMTPFDYRERPARYRSPDQPPPDQSRVYVLDVVASFQNDEQVKIQSVKRSAPVLQRLPRAFSTLNEQIVSPENLDVDQLYETVMKKGSGL